MLGSLPTTLSNHFGTSFGAIIKRETGSIVRSSHSSRLLRIRCVRWA